MGIIDVDGDQADVNTNADSDTNLDDIKGVVTNSVIYGRTSDDDIKPVMIDSNTQVLTGVDYPHHERHAGRNFGAIFNDLAATSLIVTFRVEPDQTREPHFNFFWKTENSGVVTMYKGATWDSGSGSAVLPINSNDNSSNTSILQGNSTGSFVSNSVVKNPSNLNVSGATIVYGESVWSTNQAPASGHLGIRDERIMTPGETYAISITQASGGLWLYMDWYEHIPRNSVNG